MVKQGCLGVIATLVLLSLWGCTGVGSLWTGASLIYDRHNVYKKIDDYHLYMKVNNALAAGNLFKNSRCVLDIAVFNGDILVAGHLPTFDMLNELNQRLGQVRGYRRLFNEVRVINTASNAIQDGWITTKIRSQIFADDSIDPNAFKIITSDGIVYLMGDVRPGEAKAVVTIARRTIGVVQVVKMFKYLVYEN